MKKTDWITREIEKGYSKEDVQSTFKLFNARQQKFPVDKRNIFCWDAKELEDHLKEMSRECAKTNDRGKYMKLHDDDRFLLIRVDDEAAAAFWGLGTRWCITQSDSNYYSNYRNSGNVFYYLIDKKAKNQSKNSRFALCVDDKLEITYYKADDSTVVFSKLPKHIREFLKDPSEKKAPTKKK
ncbi:MAG: hypothetical protein WC942_12145 [Clostridia bacterium]|jgi:hypothetical protein